MIQHVAFFVYPVRELALARQFYEGLLGLKLAHNFEEHWLEYDIQGVTLAITDWLPTASAGAAGPGLALEVAHAESTLAFLQEHRVRVLKPLFETPGCRMAVIADPDGNGIILHETHAERKTS